jgi:hypothetical protein
MKSGQAGVEATLASSCVGLLTSTDIPALAPFSLSTSDPNSIYFPISGLVDGIYTNANAGALVGRSADALFIAFRGTNDFAASQLANVLFGGGTPDMDHWYDSDGSGSDKGMSDHYRLFDAFINNLKTYLNANLDISKVYVTGHSLGAAMTQKFMSDNLAT